MKDAAQEIRIVALQDGRPTTEDGEENLACWQFEFKLAPSPSKEWRNFFMESMECKSKQKQSAKIESLEEETETSEWSSTIWLSAESSDIILVKGSPSCVQYILPFLKTIVKKANKRFANHIKHQQEADKQKRSIYEDVEKLKRTLDFS